MMSASSREALHLLLAGAWGLGIQTEAGLLQGCEGWYTRSHTAARLSPLGSQNMNSGLFFFFFKSPFSQKCCRASQTPLLELAGM